MRQIPVFRPDSLTSLTASSLLDGEMAPGSKMLATSSCKEEKENETSALEVSFPCKSGGRMAA